MNKIAIIFLLLILFISNITNTAASKEEKTMQILTIIASSNFRDEELLVPKKIFEEKGYKVTIASSSLKPCRGMLGAKVTPDILLKDVNTDDYNAIVFVGGSGASEYWDDMVAHKIAKDTIKKQKTLAAICIAPVTLANAGVLSGKRATVWPSEADMLVKKGASYTGSAVEVDGKLITANGPAAAKEFAEAILKSIGE